MDKKQPKYEFVPNYAVTPGETLLEVMAFLEMTHNELALRAGMIKQNLTRIF